MLAYHILHDKNGLANMQQIGKTWSHFYKTAYLLTASKGVGRKLLWWEEGQARSNKFNKLTIHNLVKHLERVIRDKGNLSEVRSFLLI